MTVSRLRNTGKSDASALLADANSASQHLAALHIAFMAVCAYVLVIVFGTTDLDLLIGKGIRLPVVDVEVPIVGFYAFAPYLLVLVHLNLLLQLQLLSRKLFAFDAAAPENENLGGLHDRLHIFPYTYYLVGRPSPVVRALVGLLVSITLVLLPLATLLALQLEFLAYQGEAVTWWQRLAIWLDVALIVALWPIILHPRDDWRGYWRELIAVYVPRRRVWLAFAMLLLGLFLALFGAWNMAAYAGLTLLVLAPLALILLRGWVAWPRVQLSYFLGMVVAAICAIGLGVHFKSLALFLIGPMLFIPLAAFWIPQAPRGALALLLTLYIGPLIPLAMMVDGEKLEREILRAQGSPFDLTVLAGKFLTEKRALNVTGEVLLAKQPKPETLALLYSGRWHEALTQLEPLKNLSSRSLRHARMNRVILIGSNLQNADLQGANLLGTQLQGTNLENAQLQGANLIMSQLQGANLLGAKLQGANLRTANLQGADLVGANLNGTDLVEARLQGTYVLLANLVGTDLRGAQLYGIDTGVDKISPLVDPRDKVDRGQKLVDARDVGWVYLSSKELAALTDSSTLNIRDRQWLENKLDRLKAAAKPGKEQLKLWSCLTGEQKNLTCISTFDPSDDKMRRDFMEEIHVVLTDLACESPDIARGIIAQIPEGLFEPLPSEEAYESSESSSGHTDRSSTRYGLEIELKQHLDDPKCPGLRGLRTDEKNKLRKKL